MPTSRGDRARAVASSSPVSSTGSSPSPRRPRDRLGARRLDRVARRRASRAPRRPSETVTPLGTPRPTCDLAALDDAAHADARLVAEALDGRQRAELGPRRARDRPGDGMLAGRLDGAREPQHARARVVAVRAARRRRAPARPLVTVPVLSSTIVSHARVRSSTSGPRIRMPSCAPRPVPTISAVGVASPSAHGHAMISTATAAVNASDGVRRRASSQPASVASASDEHDRHEDGRDAVGEPLHRRLAGLRLVDEPRDLRQRRVGADARRAHDEPAGRVERAARDLVARARRRPGTDSPVSSRRSTRRGAFLDDAVGRDPLARPHDEAVADLAAPRPGPAPRRRPAARAPPSRRARAARAARRRSAASRAPRGSGRAGSAS